MGYHVRLAEPSDRAQILDLLGELFGHDGGDARLELERRFTWLYENNPHGKALTWVAIDDETREMVGCTSFFARKLALDGGLVPGALGGDGFVRPRFRRRGIGAALHRASRRDMRALGVEVMFGTPLPANVGPLARAGSRNVTHVARYVRPLSLRALGVRAGAVNRLASTFLVPGARARLDPVRRDDARVEAVWRDVRGRVGLTTSRDAAMYTWRFVDAPSQRQRAFVVLDGGSPIGVCALERVEQSLRIVELVAPSEAWGEALRAICSHARGCSSVDVRLTPERAAAHRLWRHGFLERGGAMPLNVVLPEGEPRADVFWDPRRWYVTWLETDQDSTA